MDRAIRTRDGLIFHAVALVLSALPAVFFLTLCPALEAAPHDASKSAALAEATDRGEWCGIMPAQRIWDEELGRSRMHHTCAQGACDTLAVRNATEVFPITVRLVVHVMRDEGGGGGVSQQDVDDTIARVNADFAPHDIQFLNTATLFHNDSTYFCIPPYHPDSTQWLDAIQSMKSEYAQTPEQNCNIFISCMTAGPDTLWGIGYFPWRELALTAEGGIWLNADLSVGTEARTATHELGHNLGLWHTHRLSEVLPCTDCYEYASGQGRNRRGDLCGDTRATPRNYACADPVGEDCQNTPWGATPYLNHMGYSPDDCANEFTFHQTLRMHCWTKAALRGWISAPPTGVAPVATIGGSSLTLDSTYPNPFIPPTTLNYDLRGRRSVHLTIHDVLGRRVHTLIDEVQAGGRHSVTWDGRNESGLKVPAGTYFVRLRADNETKTQKVVLLQ